MAFTSRTEARAALATNYAGNTGTLQSASMKGLKTMGDNGPRKLYGNMTTQGKNTDGLKGGKLYGKTGTAKTSSGVGGNMTSTGYPSPPRQSMASSGQGKTTVMHLGEGDVKAKMQPRGPGPKSIRGGNSD